MTPNSQDKQTDLQQQLHRLKVLWRKQKAEALAKSSQLLCDLSAQLRDHKVQQQILTANQQDLAKLDPSDPMYDRLLFDKQRLGSMADDLKQVASLPCPVGQQLYSHKLANGVEIYQRRVPIGLVLVIYESRPNVTIDLFSLAIRSGNLLLLKGGKEAFASNSCLVDLIRKQLQKNGLSPEWVTLLGTSRQELSLILQQEQHIDLCIPRGSSSLIGFVRENSRIPVIETGAGVVHLFCDQSAPLEMAAKLIYNSKLRRLSVCNALDCLLLHQAKLNQLPQLLAELIKAGVIFHCDPPSYAALAPRCPAKQLFHSQEEHYGQEFLSAQLCLKVVANLEEAIEHIEQYGSHHTEVIISENPANIALFCEEVDAASVFVNMASGFSDGGQFGLGAEVGISTQKLHARGPMGLEALTCTKWYGRGEGQTRH